MTFPITITSSNGHFTARVLGAPELQAAGTTRDQALQQLRAVLADLVRHGELVVVDVAPAGASALAGKYAADPTLRDICEEAYHSRDARAEG